LIEFEIENTLFNSQFVGGINYETRANIYAVVLEAFNMKH